MDRLLAMQTFARVVEAGSFVRAAERLGISTTAASRLVADLEARLATRLLNRTTRRLSLTEAGQAYYERCQQILHDIDDAEIAVGSETRRPAGLLRLSAPFTFGHRHLAPLLLSYRAAYPEVTVEVSLSDRMIDLVEEGIDLALRITRQPAPNLVARRLAPARILPCAAPAYLARHGTPGTPAELASHNCLVYTYGGMHTEWRFAGPEGDTAVRVAGSLRANNGDMLRAAALAGEGIVLEPSFNIGDDLRSGRLVPLLPAYRVAALGILAVYPSRRYLSAKVRSFVDHLVAGMGEAPPWDTWLDTHPAFR
ncbi:LysR family transcriptional regulator [Chitinivorax sp. PXF-14]|uniref:LysR family transcriptional regulator n=1 Tax=Chitinivorax sp. PXF-14 TaxID=3230488 RepID=UPI003466E345